MTSTYPLSPSLSPKTDVSPDGANAADAAIDDLASKSAAALREVKANLESVIAGAGETGQRAVNYAGQKGQEAIDNVREVGDTLAVAIEKSVAQRPYVTLALVAGLGFLFGAAWRR
jgi:ElaB/YqjD/DUF883 family membrane-anchored ribosome-binding protein